MKACSRKQGDIQVCMGAGCKSWGAGKILRTLKTRFQKSGSKDQPQVSSTRCMNRCGGGANVCMGTGETRFKFRDISDAASTLVTSWSRRCSV